MTKDLKLKIGDRLEFDIPYFGKRVYNITSFTLDGFLVSDIEGIDKYGEYIDFVNIDNYNFKIIEKD